MVARSAPTGRTNSVSARSPDFVRPGGLHPGLFSSLPSGKKYRTSGKKCIIGSAGLENEPVLSTKFLHAIDLHPKLNCEQRSASVASYGREYQAMEDETHDQSNK